ncbi:MAG: DNA-directed RNA polymerase subunit beta [Rickettsiales bacterium]|nr:DNA-directed RNA polymerase subunit beta [Pseudomonadota bacterium]MDA0967145.1 DNA-directed RNA polymerase subunit beta [Pseudomonadota bacterium]MDG4544330.1 DNA-directed RNA polymerase subunit beta [Rickettsiales bacterium]MDG4546460.1 DNA-directed RNA polymerase subunit beta [Rickettsiales bacterium]MDG4548606.1 DNA-directed RNA polymerase subunit beta [Rickettsiales bacterium]
MAYSFTARKRIRKSFGKIEAVAEMPNLIDIQSKSYESFLQMTTPSEERSDVGLNGALASVFPINDMAETCTLEYIGYAFDKPKYDVEECRQRGINFSAPLKVTLRLIVWDVDEDTGAREIKGIKEQDVYMGDIPLMTKNGTFIINGTERVIVSQMHRSPGVFFDHDRGKTHSSGKFLYSARIIPYRGSWLDFEFDAKDLLFFRIDRRRKLLIGTLLRALGFDKKQMLETFYNKDLLKRVKKGWSFPFNPDALKGTKLTRDLIDAATGKVVAEAGTKMSPRVIKKLVQSGMKEQLVSSEDLVGKYVAEDIIDPSTGEVFVSFGDELTSDAITFIENSKLKEVSVLSVDPNSNTAYIRNSVEADKNVTYEDALMDVYKVMRPGEPATVEAAEELFHNLFFDKERYDLSAVGRVKLNARLDLNTPEEVGVLTKEDIITIIRKFVDIKDGKGEIDDIDHLGNRRVRSVGELMENQFRIGLVRMERAIIERMAAVEIDTVMPHDLVNSKLLAAVLREFFGSSQLSQFMDQTNPLAEITHKRRLSALGPGGLTRDRAGFEVRDVHTTHYGRICPIETPEGPNIGLINSLATYANINKYGFIESPYRKVVEGKVTNEVSYMSAIDEGKYVIAQSNAELNSDNRFVDKLISCRKNGELVMVNPKNIDYMDVSPMQVVSVAACLIPFLENDDANRALMGSNMQRQAVPLLRNDAPLVGTGIEATVARDSGVTVVATRDGVVEQVDANRIVVKSTDIDSTSPGVKIYNLLKYQRTNQNTSINQRPVVKAGDVVKKGDIIADGSSTDLGELALGRNVLVAFMPWNGYNFEDSILISERIVKDDVFTSVHIEQFEVVARDTRIGPEEVTRDIPNVGEESLKHLDEIGIVHVGAEVMPGDILVGKVTPKSESPMTPEEKLLRAIFGEKAADVRDSSLRVPPGVGGTVVEVRVFSRRGIEKDERALSIEQAEIERLAKDRDDELAIVENFIYGRLKEIMKGKEISDGPKEAKSGKVSDETFEKFSNGQLWQIVLKDSKAMDEIEILKGQLDDITRDSQERFDNKVEKLQSGDDLPQGALKVVKVFLAVKRKLQPGDKMAGRHGNKGVISRILPQEDMPYLEDGTPVDVVLNPLGVPSRMNVGQILETHLGWASAGLGKQIGNAYDKYTAKEATIDDLKKQINASYKDAKVSREVDAMNEDEVVELARNLRKGIPFATPVFDGAKEADIVTELERAGLNSSGQVTLYDGRTGEKFDRDVTVGYIYMLKLHHLVDDKIHARSIGPYSLVTQQPLGGKSHFGGQRFGEMECWALQAYGSSYTLQEMLTVKSDDVAGRIKMYEAIVRGDNNFESGIPESFHVMVKELRSLCLNVALEQSDEIDDVTPETPAEAA